MRRLVTIGGILCATAILVNADTEEERKKRLERELRNIPILELPARAATIVRSTPAAERSQAAIIVMQTVRQYYPAAAASVSSAVSKVTSETAAGAAAAEFRATHHQEDHSGGTGNGNANPGPGNSDPNGNANGGVGLGPGDDKPGRPIVHDRPINVILPNGKPRHFPPDPPRRPVDPPRPHQYNTPRP